MKLPLSILKSYMEAFASQASCEHIGTNRDPSPSTENVLL